MFDMRVDPEGNLLPGKTWDDSPGLPPAQTHMLLSMLDAPIAIDRCFVEACEDFVAGALLTELSAIESETTAPGAWVAVSPEDIERRISLPDAQQVAALRVLVDQGLIEHSRRDAQPDEFRIRWPELLALIKRRSQERTAGIPWPPKRPDDPSRPGAAVASGDRP
ncbi:hypothetical protein [Paraburkholderia sp. BL21I4N1]|uniref:hypothetical protein n=1 Tax=Paraburkholderia sp. BL21I4N1 TaxID=1938801 RepID=UPI000CFB38C5|nr:hypothetical protein [Paraburkholderia sp. BL21I4N1]PQV44155.1 hypothetical protein B0G83_12753 [Paraburkholderia sp. BL21I4N1]